jgi:hypothetical protein
MENGWVKPVYDDERVAQVYNVLLEHSTCAEIIESGDKSLEITEWMENNMTHLSFAELLKFPGGFRCFKY